MGEEVGPAQKAPRPLVLILWNQVEEDVYEQLAEQEMPLSWDPSRIAADVGTVRDELNDFLEALVEGGYRVECVNIRDDVDRLIDGLRYFQPDVVFNLVEYLFDDESYEIHVTSLFELFGIPYTGSDPVTLATCFRKIRTKILLTDAGLPTPSYFVVDRSQDIKGRRGYRYPLIVKPPRDDASAGIERASVVADRKSLLARIQYVHSEFEQAALVEQYISGREIHAAVLGNENPVVLPLFEMEFEEDESEEEEGLQPHVISYDAKWDPTSQDFYSMEGRCPPLNLPDPLRERIEELALAAYRLLECRDYARVDMRIDEEGNPYILEVNPNPDLANDSAFVLCAKASGRTYSALLCEVVAMALARREEGATQEAPVTIQSSDHLLRKFTSKPASGRQEVAEPGQGEPNAEEAVSKEEEVA